MSFIEDHQVPGYVLHIRNFGTCELVGAKHHKSRPIKGIATVLLLESFVALRLKDVGGNEEFFVEFSVPLFAKRCRDNAKNASLAFSPKLTDD